MAGFMDGFMACLWRRASSLTSSPLPSPHPSIPHPHPHPIPSPSSSSSSLILHPFIQSNPILPSLLSLNVRPCARPKTGNHFLFPLKSIDAVHSSTPSSTVSQVCGPCSKRPLAASLDFSCHEVFDGIYGRPNPGCRSHPHYHAELRGLPVVPACKPILSSPIITTTIHCHDISFSGIEHATAITKPSQPPSPPGILSQEPRLWALIAAR